MKKDNPLVSVIIPAFNEEKGIEKCLKTILDQTYKNTEVIVVDDGSDDNTLEIIKRRKVILLKQPHLGPAKARNLGARLAKGEILVFIDADMAFDKKFIEDLVAPVVSGVYKGTFSKEEWVSNWENVWARCWNYNNNILSSRRIPENYPDEGIDFRAILKDEFLKVGGFDDTGYTDTWTLVKKLGYHPHSVFGAVYYHANPDSLGEIFKQTKWVAKRPYKLGLLGQLISIIKYSLPVSIVIGLVKSFYYLEPNFLIFKLVYDLGSFWGILEKNIQGKIAK